MVKIMNKHIIALAILTGMVVSGMGQTTFELSRITDSELSPQLNYSVTYTAAGKVVGANIEIGLRADGAVFDSAIPPIEANCDIPYVPWRYAFGPWTVASDFNDCTQQLSKVYEIVSRPFGEQNWTVRDSFTLSELVPMGFCNLPPPKMAEGRFKARNILYCPGILSKTFDE